MRLYLACVAISSWLVLLLSGHAWGGWAHLLLVVSLVLFPWRAGRPPSRDT